MPVAEHYIVVGVDGSRPSIDALRWAARQAGMTGARLDAVIARQYPIAVGGLGFAPAPAVDDSDYAGLAAGTLSAAVAEASDPVVVVHTQEKADLAEAAV